ncbi:FTR1 family protein [Alkalinema sp. FACHB-956]|uniref:FTR1 family iron permease n=1 Tax=Alkalinema sp. FACHB-956 TaxID=2692768 RepID=UPI0016880777|nr:FTR1 family protein [Alkalinema sp. FACHB-956]MBD2326167.1 FTR1 family iron permease [Alkalinema sp. FACHB-956]
MDLSSALPTFVITLREGVEAALVVGIVLAYLKKARQSHLTPWVYSGVGVGLAASGLVGVLLSWFVQNLGQSNEKYGPVFEPLLEGVFSLMAIGLLSWMLIWMTQNARTLKTDVEGAIHAALNQAKAGWGVFALIFFAVIREGFETVLFISAKFQQGLVPALGALAGLAGAVAIGVMLFKLGIRLNLRKFFMMMGVLLLLIVAGLVVTALGHFDVALNALASLDRKSAALCFFQERFVKAENRACILGPMVWNFSKVLPDDRFPGVILSALFGYTQRLFMVQGVAYGVFLITVGGIYFQSLTGKVSLPFKKMARISTRG